MLFGADLAATGRRAESSGKVLNEALRGEAISGFRRQENCRPFASSKWTPVAKENMLTLGVWRMKLMKCRAAAVAVLLGLTFVGSNAEARPYGSISVGNWKGGAYTNDQTGVFSHCGAGARYDSGVFFVVMVDSGGGWSLGFMHEAWKLRTGEAFPLALTFDGQQPFNVHGIPIADKLVRVRCRAIHR